MFISLTGNGNPERQSPQKPFNTVNGPVLSDSERLRRFITANYDRFILKRPTLVFNPSNLAELGLRAPFDPVEIIAENRAWHHPDQEQELRKFFISAQKNERAWGLGYGFIENGTNQYCFARIVDFLSRNAIPNIDDDSYFPSLEGILKRENSLFDRLFEVNGASKSGNELAHRKARQALIKSSLYIYSQCYPNLITTIP